VSVVSLMMKAMGSFWRKVWYWRLLRGEARSQCRLHSKFIPVPFVRFMPCCSQHDTCMISVPFIITHELPSSHLLPSPVSIF
jgi:hypothetical protein